MAGVQEDAQGCGGLTAQDRVNDSTKPKKARKRSVCLRGTKSRSVRARVDIGSAFKSWRELKTTKGMKSDAEVASYLLDKMKRIPSKPPSSAASNTTMKFSQSEVQTLINEEVCSAMRKNETRLQHMMETIEKQVHGFDFESSIQTLEAQINTVTRRAEAALTHLTMTQTKSLNPSLAPMDFRGTEPEGNGIESASHVDNDTMDFMDQNEELSQIVETTKKSLKRMGADKDALTAAVADLRGKSSLPVPTESEGHVLVKEEPEDKQHEEMNIEESKNLKKPKTERVDTEHLSSIDGCTPKHTVSKQDKLFYPPLPPIVSSSNLKTEAALYNIPQKVEIHLALIRRPPALSVLWKIEEIDPCAPPMDSYSVYMTTEKVKGSGIFPDWKMLNEVKAIDLPICVAINNYKPGHKVYVTVIGKDIFGRYGPYSEVLAKIIPD